MGNFREKRSELVVDTRSVTNGNESLRIHLSPRN